MRKRVSILNAMWNEQLKQAEERKRQASRNKFIKDENSPTEDYRDIDDTP